jgi:CTP:molybdopterin cytidylyltransferase MocA
MSLEGDKGGKRVIRKHEDDTVYIEVPAEELYDVDTPEDLRNL